jgi:pimeloyl-ACP methyl ester carboxylesterase
VWDANPVFARVAGSAIGRRVVCRPELMALSTFAGGRLWGARYGTGGPWVLALHGWGRDHHDFDEVLNGLDAVALDLPGYGVAPEPPEPWSTLEYADWVAPVLDELGSGPVVLAGHSFGGRVAVHLAAEAERATGRQGRIGALVLTGAPLAPPPGKRLSRPSLAYRAGERLTGPGSSRTSAWSSCAVHTARATTATPARPCEASW